MHDKDWNPIRFDRKGNVLEAEKPYGVPTPDKRFLMEESAEKASKPDSGSSSGLHKNPGDKMPDQHVVVGKHHALTVYEENVLPLNTIMLLLLAFLMLIVLIFVRQRREKQ